MAQLLHGLTLLLTAALLVRLYLEGLHARYRAFFAVLLFELLAGLALYVISNRPKLYSEVYFAITAIGWVLQFLVLSELCLLVFEDHPGIRAGVRIGIMVSLALAVVIPLASLGLAPIPANSKFPILEQFFRFHQSASFFLTILFAGTVAFVTWFPVALRRNIVFYCLGFSIKFIGDSTLLLFRNATFSDGWRRTAGVVDMLVGLAVVCLWLLWLNRAGEKPLVSVAQILRPQQAGQALGTLRHLNAFLSRVSPKSGGDR